MSKEKPLVQLFAAMSDNLTIADLYVADMVSSISFAIRKSRHELKMNKKEFAVFMGVTPQTVSQWEHGDYNFSLKTLAKICEKLTLIPVLNLTKGDDNNADKA